MTEQTAIVERKSEVPLVNGIIQPRDFDGMWRVANVYAQSGMVPKQYENKPAAIIVAGQFGAELGLSLMPSLQNIAVINGNPTLWGDAMLAIVRSSGTLEVFVEFYQGKPFDDNYTAVCIAKRTGVGFGEYNPEDDLDTMRRKGFFVNEYSVADAKKAGLWGGKGKEQWQKEASPWFTNPKRMLKMRARSFTLRDGWPDKLKGMHSVEEMMDAVDVITVQGRETERMPAGHVEYKNPMVSDADLAEQFDEQVKAKLDDPRHFYNWLNKIAENGRMTVEQAKAEIMRTDDLERCLKNFRDHQEKSNGSKPADSSAGPAPARTGQQVLDDAVQAGELHGNKPGTEWDPLTADVQQRYDADKKAILVSVAGERGIPVEGKKPSEIHTAILMGAQGITKADADEMAGRPTQAPEAGPDSSENDLREEIDLHNRFNEVWAELSREGRIYACEKCGCARLPDGKGGFFGFAMPDKDKHAAFIAAAEEWRKNQGELPFEDKF